MHHCLVSGGSPWGNVNGLTVEGQERIKEQQKQFTKLFKSFVKLVDEVYDEQTLIAFETVQELQILEMADG